MKGNNVPYRVVGGMKFFDRAEIKDMLAYLCVLNNPLDDLRFRRVVNVPARGIGGTTMDKAAALAEAEGTSLWEILERAGTYPALKAAAGKLEKFVGIIRDLRTLEGQVDLPELYDAVCDRTQYVKALEEKGDMESRGRIENVQELRSSIIGFLENDPDSPTLAGFLDSVALYTDLDESADSDNCVSLMTMHSAKGLEFPNVYVVGMEEGVFPGARAVGEEEEMEEERRLCYVAMTRARQRLVMTSARQRMLYGRTSSNLPSRFLDELPQSAIEWQGKSDSSRAGGWSGGSSFSSSASMDASRGGGASPARPARDTGFTAPSRTAAPSDLLQLEKGDAIQHRTFGKGMVLSVRPVGNDALVEVAFDGVGTKKLMLKVAGAHITKL